MKIKETSHTKLYAADGSVYVTRGTSTPYDYHDVNDAMETAVNELLAGKSSPLKIVQEIVIERVEE